MAGWFKFHREWLEHPIINKDADYLRVWIELHYMAAFDNSRQVDWKGEVITLKPGQLTTGRMQLEELTGVNNKKVFRILKRFKSEHLIEHQRSSHCSLISIVSWDEEQRSENQNEQLVSISRATDEQLVSISRATDEQLLSTNKEVKNLKNKDYSYSDEEKKRRARELDAYLEDTAWRMARGGDEHPANR